MKIMMMALMLLGAQNVFADQGATHHETKFQIWCAVGDTSAAAITDLNKLLAGEGHSALHHLKIKAVSAPSLTTEIHELQHHTVRACVTVTYTESHT